MQDHIRVGREYPQVDNHTTYSFGLDDQEFVVAFDTDDASAFLDLVQRLRTTEASAYTLRDTPSFTCIATSVERALSAVDGEPVPATAFDPSRHEPPRLRRRPRHHGDRRRPGGPVRGLLGRHARGQLAHHRLAARARRPADDALSREVDLRRARPPQDPGQGPRRAAPPADARAVRRPRAPGDDGRLDLLGGRPRRPAHRPRRPALAHGDRRRRATAPSSPRSCPTTT